MTEYHYEDCETCGRRRVEQHIDSELVEVRKGSRLLYYCPGCLPVQRTEDLRIQLNQGKAPRHLLD